MGMMVATSGDVKSCIARLEGTVKQFEKQVAALEQETKTLEQENQRLQEKLKPALFRQFARHAEKFAAEGQPPLFDSGEGAAPAALEQADETETVKSCHRAKRGRKPIDENIPRLDEIIDIAETEKQRACGSPLVCIGEDVIERLAMIPEQAYALRYHVKKYACHEREGSGDEERPAARAGKAPVSLTPGSIATPELLSYIFTKKYCDYVPYYRQEGAFERIGVQVSRQNMANWQQKVCEAPQPLLSLTKNCFVKC
jgi:transposase